jgi:hypothetical protein
LLDGFVEAGVRFESQAGSFEEQCMGVFVGVSREGIHLPWVPGEAAAAPHSPCSVVGGVLEDQVAHDVDTDERIEMEVLVHLVAGEMEAIH